jgi:hypothetical protein
LKNYIGHECYGYHPKLFQHFTIMKICDNRISVIVSSLFLSSKGKNIQSSFSSLYFPVIPENNPLRSKQYQPLYLINLTDRPYISIGLIHSGTASNTYVLRHKIFISVNKLLFLNQSLNSKEYEKVFGGNGWYNGTRIDGLW